MVCHLASDVFLWHGPSGHRPVLEGGTSSVVNGWEIVILRLCHSHGLLLWSPFGNLGPVVFLMSFSWKRAFLVVASLLFLSSPSFGPILLRHVRFGFSEDELLRVFRLFVYALNVCKFSIWVARNDLVLERIKSPPCFHLPLFFRRFKSFRCKRYFAREWCTNGVVGSVRDGRLVLSI